MKKLFLGLGLVAGTFAFAQSFGIKGGMNVSSLSNDGGLDDSKSKIGFNAGVFMNAPIAESFSIQPEVLYSQYGSKVESTVLGNKFSSARKLDYITVPVMFQYNATPAFYLEAGPEFGFLASAKQKATGNNNSSITELNKDNFNTFNFGVGLGAGYYFTPNVGLTARYVAGFTDTYKDNNGDAIKNNVFQVGLAYKF